MQGLLLGGTHLHAGVNFSVRCPSNYWNDFDSYGAFGKMRIGLGILDGKLEWSDKLLEILYADPLCGACDVGCKRNLDLEIGLTLEALRVKAVQDVQAPCRHIRRSRRISPRNITSSAPPMRAGKNG